MAGQRFRRSVTGVRSEFAEKYRFSTIVAMPTPSPAESTDTPARRHRPPTGDLVGNVVRGGLIGVAETIPGVSGGTVALITGIYGRLIGAAKHLTDVAKALLTRGDWRAELRKVDWWLLLSVGIGAVLVVVLIAGLMRSFVVDHTVAAYSLFMGMIAMSVLIPFLEIAHGSLRSRTKKIRAAALFVIGAAVAFTITSLPRAEFDSPPLPLVFVAAAIAVCALVLPGVSGSFFLLVMGLYTTTLAAVDERDVPYLVVFAAGAVVGLVSFVRLLEWALENHHTTVMVTAAGLLLGSTRALWPWQETDAEGEPNGRVLPVGDDWPMALGLFVLGVVVVGVVAFVQRRWYAADAAATALEKRRELLERD